LSVSTELPPFKGLSTTTTAATTASADTTIPHPPHLFNVNTWLNTEQRCSNPERRKRRGEKTFCPFKAPLGLPRERTRVSVVRRGRLTAWAVSWPTFKYPASNFYYWISRCRGQYHIFIRKVPSSKLGLDTGSYCFKLPFSSVPPDK
jgi:hypothetical protein